MCFRSETNYQQVLICESVAKIMTHYFHKRHFFKRSYTNFLNTRVNPTYPDGLFDYVILQAWPNIQMRKCSQYRL